MSYEPNFRKRQEIRRFWHESALKKLKACDIVFLDPDNGLQVNSVSLTGQKGNKYIGKNELQDYFTLGKSVVFYNHRGHVNEEEQMLKYRQLQSNPVYKGAYWMGLKFVGGTIRDYIFILQPNHFGCVKEKYEALLNSNWKTNFFAINL